MIVETSHRFKFRAKCIEGKGYLLIDSIQRLSRSIRVFPGTRQPLNAEKNSTKLQTPIPPNQCSTNAARITAPLTHSRLPGSRWCARLTLDSARHPDPDPERQQYREITGTRNSADRAQNLTMMQQPGIHSLGHFSSSLDHRTRIILQEGPKGAGRQQKPNFSFSANPRKETVLIGSKAPVSSFRPSSCALLFRLREVELFQGKFKAEDLTSIRSRCSL